jgi:hypothetical protein
VLWTLFSDDGPSTICGATVTTTYVGEQSDALGPGLYRRTWITAPKAQTGYVRWGLLYASGHGRAGAGTDEHDCFRVLDYRGDPQEAVRWFTLAKLRYGAP